jgi:phosphohistidine phosphatase
MIIFVMRHGEAEPYKEDDKSRHLTSFGKTQAEHAAKWMHQNVVSTLESGHVDLALVSPYVRTQETCESALQFLDIDQVVTSPLITPIQSPLDAHDWIDGHLMANPDIGSLLIISHMPMVSLLSDSLCHGFNARIFDTSDVLVIDYDLSKGKGKQRAFYQSIT